MSAENIFWTTIEISARIFFCPFCGKEVERSSSREVVILYDQGHDIAGLIAHKVSCQNCGREYKKVNRYHDGDGALGALREFRKQLKAEIKRATEEGRQPSRPFALEFDLSMIGIGTGKPNSLSLDDEVN